MAYFNPTTGRSAVLEYDGQSFSEFILIDHGPEAAIKFEIIRHLEHVSDCFPPLPNSVLAFRTYGTTLKDYLSVAQTDTTLMSSRKLMRDGLKQILRDLGRVMVKCSRSNIKLDIDDELEHIFVANVDYPQIKAIALSGMGETDQECKTKVLKIFQKVGALCKVNDKEFNNFMVKLNNSYNLTTIEKHLDSHFFWDKYLRIRVLSKLGEFVKRKPFVFQYVVRSETLPKWRDSMEKDATILQLLNTTSQRNNLNEANANYKSREIDCLLLFLRKCIAHFSVIAQGTFSDHYDMLEYFQEKFADIMSEIYKGIEAVDSQRLFKFLG